MTSPRSCWRVCFARWVTMFGDFGTLRRRALSWGQLLDALDLTSACWMLFAPTPLPLSLAFGRARVRARHLANWSAGNCSERYLSARAVAPTETSLLTLLAFRSGCAGTSEPTVSAACKVQLLPPTASARFVRPSTLQRTPFSLTSVPEWHGWNDCALVVALAMPCSAPRVRVIWLS